MSEKIQLEIILEDGKFKASAKSAQKVIKDTGDVTKAAGDKGAKGFNQMSKGASMFGKALKGFAALGIAKMLFDLGKAALKSSAQIEQQTIALEAMTGSASNAKKLIKDLQDFSTKTPFQLPGLIDTSKQLIGFGISQAKVIDIMKNLGNMAQGNQAKMEQLALAYGKAAAKGKLGMEELNMFMEAGVLSIKDLADEFNVSTPVMSKMISQGKVGFDDLDKLITKTSTGTGRFAGILERQSHSLGGLFSTLKDQLGLLAMDMGNKMAPAFKDMIINISAATKSGGALATIFAKVGNIFAIAVGVTTKVAQGLAMIGLQAQRAWLALQEVAKQKDIEAESGKNRIDDEKKLAEIQNKQSINANERAALSKRMENSSNILLQNAEQLLGIQTAIKEAESAAAPGAGGGAGAAGQGDQGDNGQGGQGNAEGTVGGLPPLPEFQQYYNKKVEIFQNYANSFLSASSQMYSKIEQMRQLDAARDKHAMDQRYAWARAYINATVTDAKERDKQLAQLEQIKEIQEKQRARKGAKRARDFQFAQAIINALSAAVGALSAFAMIPIVGPFLGIAMSAVMLGMGMATAIKIRQQPLPSFAQGVYDIPRDTTANIHAGETILTKPITDEIKAGNLTLGGGENNQSTIVHTTVELDGEVLTEVVDEHRAENARSMGLDNYASAGVY